MSDVTSTTSRGPSRRAVVRTAAHAAWVVPAIQVATSVPAFAAISDNIRLVGAAPNATVTGTPPNKNIVTLSSFVVNNDGPNDLDGRVRLTLTSTKPWASNSGTSGTWAWTVSGADLTATYAGPVPLGDTLIPGFTVNTTGNNPTITVGAVSLA